MQKYVYVGYVTRNRKHHIHGFDRKIRIKVSYETGGTWVITTPAGENIKFKIGTGAYDGMP